MTMTTTLRGSRTSWLGCDSRALRDDDDDPAVYICCCRSIYVERLRYMFRIVDFLRRHLVEIRTQCSVLLKSSISICTEFFGSVFRAGNMVHVNVRVCASWSSTFWQRSIPFPS